MKLLEGQVTDDDVTTIADLMAEVRTLRAELAVAKAEATKAKREASHAFGELRRQLTPLHRVLQAIFGELDAAGVDDAPSSTSGGGDARTVKIWESWKARMPGGPAKIIDALMLQPDMNTQQLAIATGVHRNSIPAMIYKLNKAGLLNKNGQRFSLKAL